jgi:hypothetical protein
MVSVTLDGWEERGYGWQFVTSSSAWIDGHGVAKQAPHDLSYMNV